MCGQSRLCTAYSAWIVPAMQTGSACEARWVWSPCPIVLPSSSLFCVCEWVERKALTPRFVLTLSFSLWEVQFAICVLCLHWALEKTLVLDFVFLCRGTYFQIYMRCCLHPSSSNITSKLLLSFGGQVVVYIHYFLQTVILRKYVKGMMSQIFKGCTENNNSLKTAFFKFPFC